MAGLEQEISIDGNIGSWNMRLEGDIQGTYTGLFKFRCYLTPLQKISANRELRELLGPQMTMASEHESNLAFALTQLKYRIVSAPPFWRTESSLEGDIPDYTVLLAVLDASFAAELKYMEYIKQRKLDAIERAKKSAEQMLNSQNEEDSQEEIED